MRKMKANRKFINGIKGEKAVSAVIGVILMVAITVAIAATVYVYVSGMLPSSSNTTPTVSMTAAQSLRNCTITMQTTTPTTAEWRSIWYTIVDATASIQILNGAAIDASHATVTIPSTGSLSGGQIVIIRANGFGATSPLITGHKYTFTLVFNVTSGTMGTVSWTQ
ncbi:MAG: type IV pilin [Euryarchaeota archaeon]|nr:type IV pilin [Euryarchaeota archaeon]